jgi:CRISPR-associated protein Cas2
MMFVIMVYDIDVSRVTKVLKISRQYLNWVQNSVFEGEIEKPGLERLKKALGSVIDDSKDSVIIYELRTKQYYNKSVLGIEKAPSEVIL